MTKILPQKCSIVDIATLITDENNFGNYTRVTDANINRYYNEESNAQPDKKDN
jgi:hypothetical protein